MSSMTVVLLADAQIVLRLTRAHTFNCSVFFGSDPIAFENRPVFRRNKMPQAHLFIAPALGPRFPGANVVPSSGGWCLETTDWATGTVAGLGKFKGTRDIALSQFRWEYKPEQ